MERYHYSDSELAALEENCIPFGVYQYVDRKVVTIALSAGFMELFGFTDRAETYDLMDNNMYRDAHPDDIPRITDAAIRFAARSSGYDVVYRTLIDGSYHLVRARGKHIFTKTGEKLAYVWYSDEGPFDEESGDIFDKAIKDEEDRYSSELKSEYDHLTGLPGLNHFFELAEAKRRNYHEKGQDTAVVFLNFSGMKGYNLKFGFAEGDKLLIDMAKLMVNHFSDGNCGRLGGDRFVAFCLESDAEKIVKNLLEDAKKLNKGNSLPVRAGIYPDRIGEASIGIACDRAKMVCDNITKGTDSEYAVFSQDLFMEIKKKQYIVDHFDQAMRENWIKAYYQPIVRGANGRVCDEEALARWIDPRNGFLSPAEFIPVLEDAGLIYKLDLYILEQVLLKMRRLAFAGLFLVPCSINISRLDFAACDVVEEIRRRVDESGISRSLITIEITESVLAGNLDYMKEQVERFHKLGFKVWMDDFGSGYSSPDILMNIPFDTLKLDMMFIRQFETNPSSKLIIGGLVKMAASLGIDTVVEGVESEEQAEFLKEIGCTKLQGYHYCKPIPVDDIFKRYEEGSQIGFENPDETEYYSEIGKVNLYDLSLSVGDEGGFADFFDTLPMSIAEIDGNRLFIRRANQSYRKHIENCYSIPGVYSEAKITDILRSPAASFLKDILKCAKEGGQLLSDQKTQDGKILHTLIRRISVNPVNNASAMLVVVLGITEDMTAADTLNYAYAAKALSTDYIDMYTVNLETEEFIAYRPDSKNERIAVERRGNDFFETAREDALAFLYPEDRETFISRFTKENVVDSIEKFGSFTITYRLVEYDGPIYVNLKAIYMGREKKNIIIGVTNVDTQLRQQHELERAKKEQQMYSRIMAIAGDYFSFFAVDPESENYYQFNSTDTFDNLNVATSGADFFTDSRQEIKKVIHKDDCDRFLSEFTKEKIMEKLESGEVYSITYRLMIEGKPVPVRLKAVMTKEDGEKRILVGVRKE
ncbi:MAG: EAL domain-containing protein [Lachnospiraceae bacterium]|nr:EAL domain-containing protein [Lachnospiraceae bacterium]